MINNYKDNETNKIDLVSNNKKRDSSFYQDKLESSLFQERSDRLLNKKLIFKDVPQDLYLKYTELNCKYYVNFLQYPKDEIISSINDKTKYQAFINDLEFLYSLTPDVIFKYTDVKCLDLSEDKLNDLKGNAINKIKDLASLKIKKLIDIDSIHNSGERIYDKLVKFIKINNNHNPLYDRFLFYNPSDLIITNDTISIKDTSIYLNNSILQDLVFNMDTEKLFDNNILSYLSDLLLNDAFDNKSIYYQNMLLGYKLLDILDEYIKNNLKYKNDEDEIIKNNKIISFVDYIEAKEDSVSKDIMLETLKGAKPKDLAKKYKVTSYNINKVVVRTFWNRNSRRITFKEDFYKYLFSTYQFTHDKFIAIFHEKEETYNYLYLKCRKRNKKPYIDALSDDKVNKELKDLILKYKNRKMVLLDGKYYKKNPYYLLEYYTCKYCLSVTSFDNVITGFNQFLNDHNVVFDCKPSVIKNMLNKTCFFIVGYGNTGRYYDYHNYDYNELFKKINLFYYIDEYVSIKEHYSKYEEILKSYNVLNYFELTSLIKKYIGNFYYCDAVLLPRTNFLRFGNPDKLEIMSDIFKHYDKILENDLVNMIYESTGEARNTIIREWLPLVEDYHYDNYYYPRVKLKINEEEFSYLKDMLKEDFYLVSQVEKLYLDKFSEGKTYNLDVFLFKQLGYLLKEGYIVKLGLNLDEYFKDLILKDNVFLAEDYKEYLKIKEFRIVFNKLNKDLDIIEFGNGSYINIKTLSGFDITKEDFNLYCNNIDSFTKGKAFTYQSLIRNGFNSNLDKLGFDDSFYESILEKLGMFKYTSFDNTILFKKTNDDFKASSLLVELLNKVKAIDSIDLVDLLNNTYGIETNIASIKRRIGETSIYYNAEMDTFYVSYEEFLKEV